MTLRGRLRCAAATRSSFGAVLGEQHGRPSRRAGSTPPGGPTRRARRATAPRPGVSSVGWGTGCSAFSARTKARSLRRRWMISRMSRTLRIATPAARPTATGRQNASPRAESAQKIDATNRPDADDGDDRGDQPESAPSRRPAAPRHARLEPAAASTLTGFMGQRASGAMTDRALPQWFDDAKFGIFVHWTAAAVPAFAPVGPSPFELAAEQGPEAAFAQSPYVEWYQNSLAIDGSPVQRHHAATYGDLPVRRSSSREFLAGHRGWNPDEWADLFARAGARYVVLVTKHHDGVLLWPSAHPQPAQAGVAVRTRHRRRARRGGPRPRHAVRHLLLGRPRLDVRRAADHRLRLDARRHPAERRVPRRTPNAHWRELIDRYEPCVLWNDIGYPAAADLDALFADVLRPRARRRRQQPLRLDPPVGGAGPRRLPHARVLDRRGARAEVGVDPRHRHVVRVQPRGRRRRLPRPPTTSCGCSSRSWRTAATCCSTSARPATAPSRSCRRGGCSPSAGGCG